MDRRRDFWLRHIFLWYGFQLWEIFLYSEIVFYSIFIIDCIYCAKKMKIEIQLWKKICLQCYETALQQKLWHMVNFFKSSHQKLKSNKIFAFQRASHSIIFLHSTMNLINCLDKKSTVVVWLIDFLLFWNISYIFKCESIIRDPLQFASTRYSSITFIDVSFILIDTYFLTRK